MASLMDCAPSRIKFEDADHVLLVAVENIDAVHREKRRQVLAVDVDRLDLACGRRRGRHDFDRRLGLRWKGGGKQNGRQKGDEGKRRETVETH